jgi:hypothetical protein
MALGKKMVVVAVRWAFFTAAPESMSKNLVIRQQLEMVAG